SKQLSSARNSSGKNSTGSRAAAPSSPTMRSFGLTSARKPRTRDSICASARVTRSFGEDFVSTTDSSRLAPRDPRQAVICSHPMADKSEAMRSRGRSAISVGRKSDSGLIPPLYTPLPPHRRTGLLGGRRHPDHSPALRHPAVQATSVTSTRAASVTRLQYCAEYVLLVSKPP